MTSTGPRSGLSALVIGGCAVFLVAGGFVGFQLLTATAEIEELPTCESRTVEPGEAVTPNLVSVDVFNGSQRAGLANRVSINLQRRGFLPGQIGNSEIDVESSGVTIVTSTPDDPRVRLVASQFGDVEYLEPAGEQGSDNIVVVVGDDTDQDLAGDAAEEVAAEDEFTVCLPINPEVETGDADEAGTPEDQ